METDVIRSVAGRVKREPLTAREFDDISMLDVMRDGREEFAAADGCEVEPAQPMSYLSSFRGALPRCRGRNALQGTEEIAHRIQSTTAVALQQFHVNTQIVDRSFAVVIRRTMNVGVPTGMASLDRGAAEMKRAMGHDLGARFFVDANSATEMIRMGMGDKHRMDMSRLETGLFEPMLDGVPGCGPGEAWVDQCCAVVIDQRVHVYMAESGNVDRQLHAKNVLRDLADFFLGVFLFLSFRSAHCPRL